MKQLAVSLLLLVSCAIVKGQQIEPTLDIITLQEEDGSYAVSKTNRDTSYTVILDSSLLVKTVLEEYRQSLRSADTSIDLYTPYQLIIAPLAPLREQVLVYRTGDFGDFVLEPLCAEQPLAHESWKQHNYLVKQHSIYYGTSEDAQRSSVQRSVSGDGTTIMVAAADSSETISVQTARNIRDDFGGAIVDLSDHTQAKTAIQAARIVHLGPVAELKDNGFYIDRERLTLQAELVTYLSDTAIEPAAIENLLAYQIKSVLLSSSGGRTGAHQRIINKYYRQLFDGDRKHDALRAAINDYIRNVSGTDNAHPHYWTGIQQFGDIKSISGNVPSKLYWVLIAVMIILFVILRKSGGRLY